MFFTIIPRPINPVKKFPSQVYLIWDNWNDYNFLTLFQIIYFDENIREHDLGAVKIGYFGQIQGERQLALGDTFDSIGENFFSVGVDDSYYQKLNEIGETERDKILIGLNDIAKNAHIYSKAIKEEVFKISFLRSLSPLTITGQFRRLANGGNRLTQYNFTFDVLEVSQSAISMSLSFSVEPDSTPPTNIHILIGRNGVGKSYLIHNMIDSLTRNDLETKGRFTFSKNKKNETFANLICITFSAFDEFDHPPDKMDKSNGIQYSYIGLKESNVNSKTETTKNLLLLTGEFVNSIVACKNNSKVDRWKKAIGMLESDPIFKEEDISSWIENVQSYAIPAQLSSRFERLSSGHKVVLLTITRLVETLQEGSLVLIDEPECHLHPPLLSSFIRALSDLLIERNAVSIIATHSPVILQEVPKKCIWKLRRSGNQAIAERLGIESFGENVGILTQEVFGLEVTESGFHSILKRIAQEEPTYESAIVALDNNIGLEAKAILRNLFHQKESLNEKNS